MSALKKMGPSCLLALLVLAPSGFAQEDDEGSWFSELLGFSKHLELAPQSLGSTSGGDSTVGLGYKYSRRIESFSSGRDFDLYIESSGVFAADEASTSDRQFSHKLKLNIVGIRFGDFLQGSRRFDYKRFKDVESGLNYQRAGDEDLIYAGDDLGKVRDLYNDYTRVLAVDSQKADTIFSEAAALYEEATGLVFLEQENGFWPTLTKIEGEYMQRDGMAGSEKSWLSLEADFGVESNQGGDDRQLAGGLKLYGKFEGVGSTLDGLFGMFRGYETVDPVNFRNGPYLWAGYDLVDASENDTRRSITGGSTDSFGRFSAGAYYRNELFNLGSRENPEVVAAEFKWEYFSEQDAPSSIRAAGRDSTSYFSAGLIFDGGVFLEYKDGSKPLDIDDSQAISLGWRYAPSVGARR